MQKRMFVGAALVLSGAILGPAQAEQVLQLKTTLTNPAQCGSQLDPTTKVVGANTYFTIASKVNYMIQNGDRLSYDVLIPKESTLAAGAVDLNLSAAPLAKNGGATLRDSFSAVDQYGLFAHPATNLDVLSTRAIIEGCDAKGMPVTGTVFQRGQWLHREINLSDLRVDAKNNPVAITDVMLAFDEHDSTHLHDVCPSDPKNANVIALFRSINIVNTDAKGQLVIKQPIWNGGANLPIGKPSLDVKGSNANGTVSVVNFTTATKP